MHSIPDDSIDQDQDQVNASDQLLDELDQFDTPGDDNLASDPDFGDDLEDLLAESMSEAKAAKDTREARERRRRRDYNPHSEQAAIDNALVRQWEDRNEWRTVANSAIFHQFNCACGQASLVFEALMLRQTHRHLATSQRWITTTTSPADLPNETVIRGFEVPVCIHCAAGKGWDLTNAQQWGKEG